MTTMTKKDYYCLSALMLIFTILVFFRLGNTYAPQSAYTADENNRDIVLDLGDYLDVSSISIFLGNLDTRHFSISAFNEVTGQWEVFNGEASAGSVLHGIKLILTIICAIWALYVPMIPPF